MPEVSPAREGCREELLTWIYAHVHWPLIVELHAIGGGRLARLTGRLRNPERELASEYELDQDVVDGPAAAFVVPEFVRSVEICGAVHARFEHVDVGVAVTIAVGDT